MALASAVLYNFSVVYESHVRGLRVQNSSKCILWMALTDKNGKVFDFPCRDLYYLNAISFIYLSISVVIIIIVAQIIWQRYLSYKKNIYIFQTSIHLTHPMTPSPFPLPYNDAEVLHPTSPSPFPPSRNPPLRPSLLYHFPSLLPLPPLPFPSSPIPISTAAASPEERRWPAHSLRLSHRLTGAAAAAAAAATTNFAAPTSRDPHTPPAACASSRPTNLAEKDCFFVISFRYN